MDNTLTDNLLTAAKFAKELGSGAVVCADAIDLEWVKVTKKNKKKLRLRAIRWKLRDHPPNWRLVRPPANLALQFSNLRKAPEAEIFEFAKKWGCLGICAQHPDFPVNHLDSCLPIENAHPHKPGAYIEGIAWGLEPIRFWRRYAWRVHAVLELGRELSQARAGDYWLWRVLFPGSPQVPKFGGRTSHDKLVAARYQFSQKMAELHKQCGIANVLDWEGQHLSLHGHWIWRTRSIRPFNLINVLAAQTIKLLCRGIATMVCSGCGREYSRSDKLPKPGQANYCKDCRRDGAPQRAADDRRAQRLNLARGLLREGRSIDQVVSLTESRPSTVANLAKKLSLTQPEAIDVKA